jgi:hypothetical protein
LSTHLRLGLFSDLSPLNNLLFVIWCFITPAVITVLFKREAFIKNHTIYAKSGNDCFKNESSITYTSRELAQEILRKDKYIYISTYSQRQLIYVDYAGLTENYFEEIGCLE